MYNLLTFTISLSSIFTSTQLTIHTNSTVTTMSTSKATIRQQDHKYTHHPASRVRYESDAVTSFRDVNTSRIQYESSRPSSQPLAASQNESISTNRPAGNLKAHPRSNVSRRKQQLCSSLRQQPIGSGSREVSISYHKHCDRT